MDRNYLRDRFVTARVDDDEQGFASIELFRIRESSKVRVARLIFWDATGQFYLDSIAPDTEIPLVIMEALIAEARLSITTG